MRCERDSLLDYILYAILELIRRVLGMGESIELISWMPSLKGFNELIVLLRLDFYLCCFVLIGINSRCNSLFGFVG